MSEAQEQIIKIVKEQPKNSSFKDILIELRYAYMVENELADVVIVPVSDPDEPNKLGVKVQK